ncbi:MAG: UbiX family flavin prenyltransferase [Proteobacteria bacterium]|nr:UbiX family flavin prenyltransferase [Pseudomonadota bacterium]MCP4915398.1 UbiX family flavin prenyltransferase [Pseudomonadota bacterium]
MKRLVVGISGASGSPYARRLLDWLADNRSSIRTELIFTKTGRLVWQHEIGTDPKAYDFPIHSPMDMAAPMASGSAGFDAMAVVPCSAGCMARIAHGISADLVGRAADVMLKERRPLVLCLRESPYSLVHVRNMATLIEAGAIVMPASPNFYSNPKGMDDLVDSVVGRVLDQLGIDNDVCHRWEGM